MRIGLLTGAAAVFAASAPALAQTPPSLPPPAQPTREEIDRARPPVVAPPPSRLTVEGGIERAPCALDEPRFANVQITVQDVRFNGLRGMSADDLRGAWDDYAGQRVGIATLCQIRDAAATILRRAGYVAAVQVPPQTISGGVINFDVLMAKLVALRVRGNAGRSEKLIARYLSRLQDEEVFNERAAERYLLLARDLPGYDVSLVLRPAGSAPGEVIGEITASRQPYSVDFNVQNFGSKTVGRTGGVVTASAYDVLGFGDRLTAGFFNTLDWSEQSVLTAGYDMRVGGEGLTLAVRGTRAWTRPDADPLDPLRSRTVVGSFEASYPFIRGQASNLRGTIGLDVIDQRLRFGATPLTRDELRVAYLRVDMDTADIDSYLGGHGYIPAEPRWRGFAALELRKGLGILGASDDCGPAPLYPRCAAGVSLSRIEADPTATVARLTAQAEYRPTPKLTFMLQPRFQYSPDPLTSYEEYSGGNYTVGRGYDPGTIVGDSGVGFQSELRYGSMAPRSINSFVFQPYVFFDAAKVWNRESPTPITYSERLYSTGAGIRAAYGDRARIDLLVAQPLKRAGFLDRRGDTRILLTFTTRLLPWSRP